MFDKFPSKSFEIYGWVRGNERTACCVLYFRLPKSIVLFGNIYRFSGRIRPSRRVAVSGGTSVPFAGGMVPPIHHN